MASLMISIPKILELQRYRKLLCAHGTHHFLQFIPALARDANLLVLNLSRDLKLAVANEAGDFLRDRRLDPLLDFDRLSRVTERRQVWFGAVDVLHTHVSFRQFADDDFFQRSN